MSFQNQRNILAPLAEGLQRAGQAVGNFFMQKAQQQFQEGVTAKTQAGAKREEAMRALATGVATPEQKIALQERIRALEAVEQAPTPEAAAMWQALPNTHPIVSTILQRAARTEKGQPSGAIGVQGGPQDGQRPERVGGVTQAPATRTTATPFSGIVADVLGRANLMANMPEAEAPPNLSDHPYWDRVEDALQSLRDHKGVKKEERISIAEGVIAAAPPELKGPLRDYLMPIAGVSDPKPEVTFSSPEYMTMTANKLTGPNSFGDATRDVTVRADEAAAWLALAPDDATRDRAARAVTIASNIPQNELDAANDRLALIETDFKITTAKERLQAELRTTLADADEAELSVTETSERIQNLRLSRDETLQEMQQRAEMHEAQLRSRDLTDEEVQQSMETEALRIFNESGTIIDKKYEDFLVESLPGVENKTQLRELGQERFNRYEQGQILDLRADQLGVDLQMQDLTNRQLQGQLLTLDVASRTFDQSVTARDFLENAVNSGDMGVPYIDRLIANVRAREAGREAPFPQLEYVSDDYDLEQLQEARAIAGEVQIDEDVERMAARARAKAAYATSRTDAYEAVATVYEPEAVRDLFDPESESFDRELANLFTPAERNAIARRANLEQAIRDAEDPELAEGLESLQLLSDSRYPPELIDSQGVDAIRASLDQAGIENPQIRRGYIDAITMGWRVKNLMDQDQLTDDDRQSAAEMRLVLQSALDRTVDLMQAGQCVASEDFYQILGVPAEVKLDSEQCKVYFQTAQTLQESLLSLAGHRESQPPVGLPGQGLPLGSRPATGTATGDPAPAGSPAAGAQGSTAGGGLPSPTALRLQFRAAQRAAGNSGEPDRAAQDQYMMSRYQAMVDEGVDPEAAKAALIAAFGFPFAPQARAIFGSPPRPEGQTPVSPNSLSRPTGP